TQSTYVTYLLWTEARFKTTVMKETLSSVMFPYVTSYNEQIDVHTRAARLRLILFSKDIGAF
ncbi:MAG: hypothetical protein ACK56I_32730, partial [bacterium]